MPSLGSKTIWWNKLSLSSWNDFSGNKALYIMDIENKKEVFQVDDLLCMHYLTCYTQWQYTVGPQTSGECHHAASPRNGVQSEPTEPLC